MTRAEMYLKNIGNKFEHDGSVRYFPGNTVLSFIDHASPVFTRFQKVRKMLAESGAGECFTMLPDSSIHMTVFEGVCSEWRQPDVWTSLLAQDAELEDVDKVFEKQFSQVPKLGKVTMQTVGLNNHGGYAIKLKPACDESEEALVRYRDNLSKALGLRFPGHDAYTYHISICYGIQAPSGEQDEILNRYEQEASQDIINNPVIFELAEPNLTFFRNMFCFEKERFKRP